MTNLIFCLTAAGDSPVTGDRFRPWIAAIILIVSIIVLVVMILIGKNSDSKDDSYQDEDESE